MLIYGLQKLTLLDHPGHTACTVFLKGCDFACPYCHNNELARGWSRAAMDDGALIAFLQSRKHLLEGVAITGGEPLMNDELNQLIWKIKQMDLRVKLDTNGNHPEKLARLIEADMLDYVAMDVKNSPEKYPETCGVVHMDLDRIRESIRILERSNIEHEYRTTMTRQLHDMDSVIGIGKMISGADQFFFQKFRDSGNVPKHGFTPPTDEELTAYVREMKNHVFHVSVRE